MWLIKNRDKVPPGGWRYFDERFGTLFSAPNPIQLVKNIIDHYHANQVLPPQNLALLVDTYICEQLDDTGKHCKHADAPTLASRAKLAAQALVRFADRGFKMVTPEQLAERQEICETCHHWSPAAVLGVAGCGACGCTGLKLYAASENCPAEKWPKI